MSIQWMGPGGASPIVEFCDVRTESGATDAYLDLWATRLAPSLLAAGAAPMGQFSVVNHPGRLLVLRGYASMPSRRAALAAFHAGNDWAVDRADAATLLRSGQVALTRAITPAEGLRPIRADAPLGLLVSELRFPEQIGNYHLWLRLFLRKAGLDPFAAFATLEQLNDVPAVPVSRDRTQHFALLPRGGGLPALPPELRGMLRYPPELLQLEPALSLVW